MLCAARHNEILICSWRRRRDQKKVNWALLLLLFSVLASLIAERQATLRVFIATSASDYFCSRGAVDGAKQYVDQGWLRCMHVVYIHFPETLLHRVSAASAMKSPQAVNM